MSKVKPTSPRSRKFIIIALLVLILGYLGTRSGILKFTTTRTQPSTPPTSSPSFKLPAFNLAPPPGWTKMTPDAKTGEVARSESKVIDTEKSEGGSFTTNAIIRVKVAPNYANLEDFVTQYKKSSGSGQVTEFNLISSAPIEINGTKGYSLDSTFAIDLKSKKLLVHQLDYLFFKDGLGFLVEGYSSASSWDQHSSEIKAALDSFKFI